MAHRALIPILMCLLLSNTVIAQGFKEAPVPDFGDRAERVRDFDLLHVRIEARLEIEQETIRGRVTHSLRSLNDGVREILLDSEGLNLHYVQVADHKLPFSEKDGKLRVELAEAVNDGERLEVEIAYDGSPASGLYFVRPEPGYPDKPLQAWTQGQAEDNHYWVPMYDFPNDRTSFETFLTVPDELTAVSNGVLESVKPADAGWHTFHHVMEQPNSTYLIAFAVGPWERYEDLWRKVPVEYFVSRGVGEDKARRSFGMTPDIIDYFSKETGVDYPWPKYAQVAVAQFVVGGMENVSCTLQTDSTLHDATAALETSSQGLVAHEAAHQWFGDFLTCRTWSDLWLNEGFATYYEMLYREHTDGIDDFRVSVRSSQNSFMRSDPKDNPRPMVAEFYSRGQGRNSNHVYSKGSSVLHMLRFVLGDAGYRKSITHYLNKHRLGLVETRDLQIAIAEATGRNLEWFFEQWVYLAGYPKFKVAFAYDAEQGQGSLDVEQTQELGGLVPIFRMPVDVEFVVDGVSQLQRIFVSEQKQSFSFALSSKPSRVRFDKGGWITKQLEFERSLEEWIEIAEQDDDIIGRLLAVEALEQFDDARATECLAGLLQSTDHFQVRQNAASALSKRKGDRAKEALLLAASDGPARVRSSATRALSSFKGDPQVERCLREILATDRAYGPRAAAVESLVKLEVEDAFDIAELALIIPSEKDQVARAALNALVEADPRRAAPYVIIAATYGVSIDLRHEALRRIGKVAPELTEQERQEAVEVVRSGLSDLYARTRSSAIRALQSLKATEALVDLDRMAKEDRNQRVRSAARRAADRIRTPEAEAAGTR